MNPLPTFAGRVILCGAAIVASALPASAHFIVDLSVAVKAPDFVARGSSFAYTIEVRNLAYDPASGVIIDDQLPPTVKFSSANGTGWSCSESKGHVTCANESFPSGLTTITINVTAPSSAGTITDSATATSVGSTDPVPSNDTGTATTVIYDPAACTASAPAISSPQDDATLFDGAADFAWSPAAGATRYRLWAAVEGARPFVAAETSATHLRVAAERGAAEWWVEALFDGCPAAASEHIHLTSHGGAAQYGVDDFAGQPGSPGTADGTVATATFEAPVSLGFDSYGNLFVADADASTIRRIRPNGTVTTVAGKANVTGSVDTAGPGLLNHPRAISVGPASFVFIADSGNHTIRHFDPGSPGPVVASPPFLSTIGGSPGAAGSADGSGQAARFTSPQGIAVSPVYMLVAADTGTDRVRQLTQLLTTNVVTTLAGAAGAAGFADGSADNARFDSPAGVAIDDAANVFVADTSNDTIRLIGKDGVVTTIAGTAGAAGLVDGPGTAARFNHPTSLAFDPLGNLYVVDSGNHAIRRIAPSGLVSTVIGAGTPGHRNGPGTTAQLHDPAGITVDSAGRLFIADASNNVVRVATPASVILPDETPVTGGAKRRAVGH